MTEEEAFWVFTHIVEGLMPLDYYSSMMGANVDQKVIEHFLKEKMPKLHRHFEEHFF